MASKISATVTAGMIVFAAACPKPAAAAIHTFFPDQIREMAEEMVAKGVRPGSSPYDSIRSASLLRTLIEGESSDVRAMQDYLAGARTTAEDVRASSSEMESARVRCVIGRLKASFDDMAEHSGTAGCSRTEDAAHDRLQRLFFVQHDMENPAPAGSSDGNASQIGSYLDRFVKKPMTSLAAMTSQRDKDIGIYRTLVAQMADAFPGK